MRVFAWLRDPVGEAAYRARSLFDLRAVHGDDRLWQAIRAAVSETPAPAFIHVLANDCLDSLPPLTFFQDAVIDSFGEQSETFRLEYSALRPIVDVARVFALAAKNPFGRSTLERLAIARTLLPEHDAIFREAADTLQIVLWQQGRVGISQGTRGAELPASLLSRHDRQVLKSGFRSILRLVEFTGDRHWLKQL
jgi:CBS domain-containing protein